MEFKNLLTSDSIMQDEDAKRDKAGRVALKSNGPRKKYTIVKVMYEIKYFIYILACDQVNLFSRIKQISHRATGRDGYVARRDTQILDPIRAPLR